MPGRTRRARGTPAVEPVVHAPHLARVSQEIRSLLCPVCGSMHGERRLTKRKPYELPEVGDTINFWEYVKSFDPDKQLGVIQEVGAGRGRSFTVKGTFGPEDDPDGYYSLAMARLLQATKEALVKGWINEGEVLAVLGEAKGSQGKRGSDGRQNGHGYGKIPRK